MKPDASHIKQIKVVSNTHWDREFKWSFEKTRRRLLDMMDVTLDILENDPKYHSYTMDAHVIMIDDYLEMRPERREQIERFVKQGRLVIGPWYTLSEDFNLSHEALVRNLILGRQAVEKYGGKCGTVGYKPSSWGQTGQLPQILSEFGIDKVMFYRGISHHEADAEWIWEGVDGTRALASRFAFFARYNWYYLVHRVVTVGRSVYEKDYDWGGRGEVPFRFADSMAGDDISFELKAPAVTYNKAGLRDAIEKMVEMEGPHFTTEVFLAMHGHDISVAHPLESQIIEDAQEAIGDKYSIEHTDLEQYWAELEKHLDMDNLPVLKGERRSYLKEGNWTYLLPGSISARTYLKQQDFDVYTNLVYCAEPLASLALFFGGEYSKTYLDRGWKFYITNHTHDANGGCAPDNVCADMEYRLRQASDIGDIVTEDAMSHIARNLSPEGLPADVMQLIVYNPLPMARGAVVEVDLEVLRELGGKSVTLESPDDPDVTRQPIFAEKSGAFVESIWDVPAITNSDRMKFYAKFNKLPAMGYRTYIVKPQPTELRTKDTLITGVNTMENANLHVEVNGDGTVDITHKKTGRIYKNLNYLTDEGECGNAWMHTDLRYDRKYNTLGINAKVAVTTSGPVVSCITADCDFEVPVDYADGTRRSESMVNLPVKIEYRLEKDSDILKVKLIVDNTAKDHWLRANFPTDINTNISWSDSHFDVISRDIPVPDPTGWVEQPRGMHPLRTFVDLTDGKNGLALLNKGLFEYEAFEDEKHTLALTLIRACRIKLMVSEEKQTELPDVGIQCPGVHTFEYAICPHNGDWAGANLLTKAMEYIAPVRAAMTGRGKGELPLQNSCFAVDNPNVHVTVVKQAEDGKGLIVRFFNPFDNKEKVVFTFGRDIAKATQCKMDESEVGDIKTNGKTLTYEADAKKIITLKIEMN